MPNDNKKARRPTPFLWIAVSCFAVAALLLAVKYFCDDPQIKLLVSVFAFLCLWVIPTYHVVFLFKRRKTLSKRSYVEEIVLIIIWVLFLLFLTAAAIRRGGVF